MLLTVGKHPRLRGADPKDRFMLYVEIQLDGCWRWTGAKLNDKGYGNFWLAPRSRPAQQAAYLLWVGEIPAGLHVLHRCDRPWCVAPDHLFLGTNAQNVADRVAKGRSSRQGAPRGAANGMSREKRAARSR